MTRAESSPQAPPSSAELDLQTRRQQRVAGLLETFLGYACEVLRHSSGRLRLVKQARAWFRQRGVEASELSRLPVGVLPEAADMQAVLCEAGFLPEEIEASRLLADPRLPGRLVGPIRDLDGRILSFWARHPQGHAPRYLIKGAWKEQLAVFGLDVALPALPEVPFGLILVADLLDALLLHAQGVRPVAAIGGAGFQMTPWRWQRLAALGVAQVTLALGGPGASEEILAALEASWAAESAPEVYVLSPDRFEQSGTVLRWLRSHGSEALEAAVQAERIHGYRYGAIALLRVHRGGGDWTDATRQAAWEAARRFYDEHAARGRTGELDAHFVPCIIEALGRSWNDPPPAEEPSPEEPVEEPLTVEAVEVAEEVAEEPVPEIPAPEPEKPRRSRASSHYCSLHQCDATECFCFD